MATGDEAAVSVDPVAVLPTKLPRDSSWLELEICRDFVRGCCNYNADECRFAHPEPGVITKGDKATCCYDFLKVGGVLSSTKLLLKEDRRTGLIRNGLKYTSLSKSSLILKRKNIVAPNSQHSFPVMVICSLAVRNWCFNMPLATNGR